MESKFGTLIDDDLQHRFKIQAASRRRDIKTATAEAMEGWISQWETSPLAKDAELGRKVRAYFSRPAQSPETAQVRSLLMSMMGIAESDL